MGQFPFLTFFSLWDIFGSPAQPYLLNAQQKIVIQKIKLIFCLKQQFDSSTISISSYILIKIFSFSIEIEDLETNYSRKKGDSHMLNLLREHYTQPLNYELGQSVLNHKWSELLYHTNRYMQRGSLMENYAIRKMQEQIICQVHNTHSIIQVLHTSTTMLLLYIN